MTGVMRNFTQMLPVRSWRSGHIRQMVAFYIFFALLKKFGVNHLTPRQMFLADRPGKKAGWIRTPNRDRRRFPSGTGKRQ